MMIVRDPNLAGAVCEASDPFSGRRSGPGRTRFCKWSKVHFASEAGERGLIPKIF
jgi:hypothetical protein